LRISPTLRAKFKLTGSKPPILDEFQFILLRF
jgi:hypothetical protein